MWENTPNKQLGETQTTGQGPVTVPSFDPCSSAQWASAVPPAPPPQPPLWRALRRCQPQPRHGAACGERMGQAWLSCPVAIRNLLSLKGNNRPLFWGYPYFETSPHTLPKTNIDPLEDQC